ncbi:hypothetical protein F4809DRAFT_658282, partial [Biscogniauxia mediterranea]
SICFAAFIQSKAVKRLEVLQRETRGPTTTATTTPNPKPSPSSPQRYLVALSLGPSSTALLRVLCENARRQKGRRGRGGVRFDLAVVHVDTSCVDDDAADGSDDSSSSKRRRRRHRRSKQEEEEEEEEEDKQNDPLTPYRALFPEVADFRVVPLSSVLRDPDVDWSALPLPPPPPSSPRRSPDEHADDDDDEDDDQRLRAMFSRLPSPSARADVRRLLVRRALLATAAATAAAVEPLSPPPPPPPLLLGYSTTALAELTLSETVKGRGFAVPAAASDGVVPVRVRVADPSVSPSPDSYLSPAAALKNSSSSSEEKKKKTEAAKAKTKTKTKTKTVHIHVYSPLRELFRKELVSYLRGTPELAAALPGLGLSSPSSSSAAAAAPAVVVSHRDLSIDDVVARYFGEVEAAYPSVVANVVRTTGKLLLLRRPEEEGWGDEGGRGGGEEWCGLCGMGLDVEGSERWRGEIGEGEGEGEGDGDGDGGGRRKLCYGCERSVRG